MPGAPLTDPGVQFSRTGLFRTTRSRNCLRGVDNPLVADRGSASVGKASSLIAMCLLGYGSQEGLPVLFRHSYGTGCLCELRCSVGPFSSFQTLALLLDTMSRSDSRDARRHFLSLRLPSCLALVFSAAGTSRASFVPCVSFRARHALGPRQTLFGLTCSGQIGFGCGVIDPISVCV